MNSVLEIPSLTDIRIDPSKSASNQIARYLKSAILKLDLLPGQMISETEVGQLFGASRTPVREAFSLVREDGLIVTYPSRGTYVSKLSEKRIRDAQFIREALELAIVERIASTGLRRATINELQQNLRGQEIAIQQNDTNRFHDFDDGFHLLLAGASNIDRMARILVREKAYLDRLRMLSLHNKQYMTDLLEDHREIFDAISAGAINHAKEKMQEHLRQVLETLSNYVSANREYFE